MRRERQQNQTDSASEGWTAPLVFLSVDKNGIAPELMRPFQKTNKQVQYTNLGAVLLFRDACLELISSRVHMDPTEGLSPLNLSRWLLDLGRIMVDQCNPRLSTPAILSGVSCWLPPFPES